MILEGNERGYGAELARHLLNPRDNDHVTVHAIDDFVADDLLGAFAEAEAISQATQCTKYLFSLSLNPPLGATVSVGEFEDTIAAVERKLGLTGQPRAIVFHEKNGRRHAHCVWSRIDASQMKAINLPHYKRKLFNISQDLYLANEWDMPDGFLDKAKRDPLNFSRAEAGQANRSQRDPKAMKTLFRRCWEQSDSKAGFAAALQEEGFVLARGDRRGFVAIDAEGKVWSLSRWCGIKTVELRARLGNEDELPSIEEALVHVPDLPVLEHETPDATFLFRRSELISRQRKERTELLQAQERRRVEQTKARRSRIPTGLRAVFFKISGRYHELLRELENEVQASKGADRKEQQVLIDRHLAERRTLEQEVRLHDPADDFHATLKSAFGQDARQRLITPPDNLPLTGVQLLQNPALILDHLSQTKAEFERADVLRALAKRIDDPFELKEATNKALQSPELIKLDGEPSPTFTTKEFRDAEGKLNAVAKSMASAGGFGVADAHISRAIQLQNRKMRSAFGGELSEEQKTALMHVLAGNQLASVIGLAGAGKSTLLATANAAWQRQGITVHGAALAGKAADGLESASGIQSRTLASLETAWANGYEPISQGDVLVVDEAGMIGTRQLARVASKIQEIGAKLVLVGDPDQLQPIEAGRAFRDLTEDHGAAQLTEIHRQRMDWQKKASRDLAAGRVSDAVERYARHEHVSTCANGEHALEALVESYAMDIAANGHKATRLAFAHRRKDVHALNQAIRAALRPEDDALDEVLLETDTGSRAFAKGERIVFARNDRGMGVKNGMLGTVQNVSASSMTVLLDGDPSRKMTFDPRSYRAFDHGYAVTIHKSQGATVDRAYVLASRSMDRHLAYVAMTRHRDAMNLYVSSDDRPKWAQPHEHRSFTHDVSGRRRSGPSMG